MQHRNNTAPYTPSLAGAIAPAHRPTHRAPRGASLVAGAACIGAALVAAHWLGGTGAPAPVDVPAPANVVRLDCGAGIVVEVAPGPYADEACQMVTMP